jgi:DNA-binding response OmpR family regulator
VSIFFRPRQKSISQHFALPGACRVKPAPSVLIIDASHESREVLRLLLERRGARTIEAERVEEAVGLANRCHPDLIVFDAECDRSTGGDATSNLREVADRNDCPIVILGKVHELLGDWAADQIVAKPYHYEPLIRKINSLLAAA